MPESTIITLYARYEARLGYIITKTLGRTALHVAAVAASYFLPIQEENRPKLITDLEADPFVEHALNFAMCELYHKYGMYLAPFTAAITTAKYCRFEHLPKQPIYEHEISRGDETGIISTTSTANRWNHKRLWVKRSRKNINDDKMVAAGKIGAAVRTHNFKQRLLSDTKRRKFE